MKCGHLKQFLTKCNDSSDIIIFVSLEDGRYIPFKNITASIFNKNAFNEELHLDIGMLTEYHSCHFPDNPTREEIEDLKEKREMLLEELTEIEEELGEFK